MSQLKNAEVNSGNRKEVLASNYVHETKRFHGRDAALRERNMYNQLND